MTTIESFLHKADPTELEHLLYRIEEKLGRKCGQHFFSGTEACTLEERRKYLTVEQLIALTNACYQWNAAASTPVQKMARIRIWLTFLLIRFGGLRLGEVLSLNELKAIDRMNRCIIISGKNARKVQLPQSVMEEIGTFLDSSMYYSLKGKVFKLDQGYVRRKFYQLAEACLLPKSLVSPSSLRIARAVELVQGGVPSGAVQVFFGEQSLNFITGYFSMPDDTVMSIVGQFLAKETRMMTSARNQFSGKVTGIKQDGLLVEVELVTSNNIKVVSVITEESFTTLSLAKGSLVVATVKAPWVTIEEYSTFKTSARNCFSGSVLSVKSTEIASEVLVVLDDGTEVCALVTQESVKYLELKKGKPVNVLFKAFSVVLNSI